jgi:L-cysteine S-thiosulfotransferase
MNLAAPLGLLCVSVCIVPLARGDQAERIAAGAGLAHESGKGNCLACHTMPADPSAITSANLGPPLIGIRARFPVRERLRRQVWDARFTNPDTVMPPFGRNEILTPEEIDLIVDYLYTL